MPDAGIPILEWDIHFEWEKNEEGDFNNNTEMTFIVVSIASKDYYKPRNVQM
jgi:hypothetical protein